jgi:hypothetical protein
MNTLAYFSDAAMPNKKVLYDSIVVMSEYFPSHLNNTAPILKDKNKKVFFKMSARSVPCT